MAMISRALSEIFRAVPGEETFKHVHVVGAILLVIGVTLHGVMNWGWIRSGHFWDPKAG
jgi:hypothetical protein